MNEQEQKKRITWNVFTVDGKLICGMDGNEDGSDLQDPRITQSGPVIFQKASKGDWK